MEIVNETRNRIMEVFYGVSHRSKATNVIKNPRLDFTCTKSIKWKRKLVTLNLKLKLHWKFQIWKIKSIEFTLKHITGLLCVSRVFLSSISIYRIFSLHFQSFAYACRAFEMDILSISEVYHLHKLWNYFNNGSHVCIFPNIIWHI